MSKDEAWKVMAVEILANAGIAAPESLLSLASRQQAESDHLAIDEAKLVKVARIEPAEDDRIQRLLAQAKIEAGVSRKDPPSMSSIIRQALRLGLDDLERQSAKK
jgi:hypothetical protein